MLLVTRNVPAFTHSRRPSRLRLVTCSVAAEKAELTYTTRISRGTAADKARETILQLVSQAKGRGKSGLGEEQLVQIGRAVEALEADGGVMAPTRSPLLEGRWKLLFTTRPKSASPIQRTFTGVEAFRVVQEVVLAGPDGPRVNNIVEFPDALGELKVEAEASTDSQPKLGFVPRRGAGLPLLGKSETGPPAARDMRIDFRFDRAAFDFKALPFKVPYPVPFKLLGDETKGWIDITYLSPDGNFRLTRGNKGTLFVLARDIPLQDELLLLLASNPPDTEVERLVDAMKGRGVRKPARSPLAEGKWRLRWSRQGENANALQKRLSRAARNFQVVGAAAGPGRLENIVELAPFVTVRACASAEPASITRTAVVIDDVRVEIGPFRVKLRRALEDSAPSYVDWLFLDQDLRITRGSRGSLFIHTREPQ